MKSAFAIAAAAALVGGASASGHGHGHNAFHGLEKKAPAAESSCGCTTIYETFTGKPTLYFPPVPTTSSTTSIETPPVVPTPVPHTCPTTGVYTFPPATVTLTETTTVCVPTSTPVTSGTNVVGGYTTVVTTATTVTCPYATVETTGDVTTSVIHSTTYVCPSAGTYTIKPTTTYVDHDTTITYPAVATYTPGTYTAPAVITTVVETSYVVYCPFDIPTPSSAPVEVTTYPPVEVPTVYPTTVAPEPEPTTYAAVTYVPTTTKAAAEPTYTPKVSTGTGLGGNVPGMPWAITFTPYLPDEAGGCMTKDQVYTSIAAIAAAGITTIRTYSTDCDTLSFVGDACIKYGVKMIIGVFVDSPGCQAHDPSISEQIAAIAAWAQWQIVPLAVIGNEGIINGYCTAQQIADLIATCKASWTGYTGPYTTAETVNIWQQDDAKAALCPAVDIVGANAWAFFNTATTADQAGVFVKGQLEIIENVCPGKDGYILETGWPTAGNTLGSAVPGYAEQAAAITSIIQECGDKVTVLSPFNDGWKDPNTPCACERSFGVTGLLGISGLPF